MTENLDKDKNPSADRSILLDFWRRVPAIKRCDIALHEVGRQIVRSIILETLRQGIEDTNETEEGISNVRHALSAQELLEKVNEQLTDSIKLSNVYFHLQKLQDAGFVETVATLREGKHDVTYFGRTAKIFLFGEPQITDLEDTSSPWIKSLTNLLTYLSPKINTETATTLIQEYMQASIASHNATVTWIEKHEDLITQFNIDLQSLFRFFEAIGSSDAEIVKLRAKLAESLDYPPKSAT